MTDHLEIHTLELQRWRDAGRVPVGPEHEESAARRKRREVRRSSAPEAAAPLRGWMTFFAEAEKWAKMPDELKDGVFEEARKILERFQRDKTWNDVYHNRLEAQRRRRTVELALEDERRARLAAEAASERAEAERQRAEAERHRAEADRQEAEAASELAEAERQKAEAEAARLRALLLEHGVKPEPKG